MDKSKSASAKYVMRSTVLSEEDLEGDMEGLRSTLQISDLRGTDTGNVCFLINIFIILSLRCPVGNRLLTD